MYAGHMTITRCTQLGEGGTLVRIDEVLESVQTGDSMVVTLFLPNIGGIVASATCVYITEEKTKIGLQFENLDMKYKVRIREFVSRQKTEAI